ncbi:MAG: C-terminal processing peptidase [Bacteroidetes bacterium]|jgi:carboxyl-terminal processing protease|nr:C-terminal processing peptidase [Bacteroidota bacterium]
MRKLKISLVIFTSVCAGFIGSSFTEDYFEVSKNLDIFATLYRELNIYYVDETKPGDLMKKGIDAMLESLDPYTVYYPESDIEEYKFMTTGQYAGIGAAVREIDNKMVITEPYEGSPAQKAGIKAGDIIVAVNGTKIDTKKSEDISKYLKGQPGSSVKLTVQHYGDSKTVDLTIIREEIKVKDVPYSGMLNNEVGYIKLTGFTQEAAKEVKEAFLKMKTEKNCKSIVLDLRGNGGGLLQQAVDIVNLFTEKGQIVATTKGKIKEWDATFKGVNNPQDLAIPLVVLVDRNSASASEVVSGALQDLDRAVIIGERTYGKGLVQQTRNLSYNSAMKVTVAKYYIPSGRCIQALDYSNKEQDGSVLKVPDSLTTAFKTKGGRIVYDGAGIMPDVQIPNESMSNIAYTLLIKNHIFEYANMFVLKNGTLRSTPRDFSLTDKEYEDFVAYAKQKDYSYETETEHDLDELKKSAEKDKQFDDIKMQYEALKSKMQESKKDDFNKFRTEIKRLLEQEIVSRFHYESGRLEAGIKYDPEIAEALKLAADNERIKTILLKIEKPTRPFNQNKKF